MTAKQTIFSGLKPSGQVHLGNYLGALKQWEELQGKNDTIYCLVDEHAITVPYDAKKLPENVLDAAAIYLAVGLDPEKSIIFVQSHVAAHTELAWLLASFTPYGELTRMTQFKDQYQKRNKNVSVGLFQYPLLMAADILLYKAHKVPVGDDQVQHLELTRDVAKRFNNNFGELFIVPEALTVKSAARIMSLTDPTEKMGKSNEDKNGTIFITDDEEVVRKKVMSAVTDDKPVVSFSKSGQAVRNLLAIYQALSGKSEKDIEKKFEGGGYKELKEALADLVVNKLAPLREKYHAIREDDDDLKITLARGKEMASQRAMQTLREVKDLMGLY